MNYLLHRQKFRDSVMRAPTGLAELMSDISREVLRERPNNHCLYEFIANYLESLLITREKCLAAQYIIDEVLKKTDEAINKLKECGLDPQKSDSAISVIRQSMKNFIQRKRESFEDNVDMSAYRLHDLFNELIQKVHLTELEILKSRPVIQCAYKKFVNSYLAAIKGHITIDMLDKSNISATIQHRIGKGPSLDQLHANATKVQAVYKGYRTRKLLRKLKTIKRKNDERFTITIQRSVHKAEPVTSAEMEAMVKAANVIQAAFRKFLKKHPELIAQLSLTETDEIMKKENAAAIVIQARYKGYSVRKKIKERLSENLTEKDGSPLPEATKEESSPPLPEDVLTDSAAQQSTHKIAESEPATELESAPEPALETSPEPAVESVPESTPEPAPEPAPEPEPAIDSVPVSAPEPETEPAPLLEAAPVVEPPAEPAPAAEPPSELAPLTEPPAEPVAEPATKSTMEIVSSPAGEPQATSIKNEKSVAEMKADDATGEPEQPAPPIEETPKEPEPINEA